VIAPFSIAATGKLTFGSGTFSTLGDHVLRAGYERVHLIVSSSSFRMAQVTNFVETCTASAIEVHIAQVSGEPSVSSVDALARRSAELRCDAVIGIGGGSVLDTAKAVAVMAKEIDTQGTFISVKRYLEGVGDREAPAGRLPLIAVPTTAGTGSEATKNAVIAEVGPEGFKKSLRHDLYIPDLVIIDPDLALAVPRAVTAASGLDALTQLLEAYVSVKANPFIDSLALEAIGTAGVALPRLLAGELDQVDLRADMAYAAYISGVAIANAGLGYVHGLAGPLGGLHDAPHGVICGSLIAPVHRAMVARASSRNGASAKFLEKLDGIAYYWNVDGPQGVIDHIAHIVELADLPRLHTYGFTKDELTRIGAKNPSRNSPVMLESEEVVSILHALY